MATKNLGKKVLSIILSLVMCFSMLNLTVFADSYENQVMSGHYMLDTSGNVTSTKTGADSHIHTENGFTVSKTIAQTGENAFDITLQVQTSQTVTTSDAAVQLIIDRSNSMKWCASCGADKGCKHNAGNRLAAVKNAIAGANGFLDTLVKNNTGRIYLSVISFGTYATTEIEWTDITTAAGLAAAKAAVNGITADGGTNLEAGLMLARNRLDMSAVASCGSKYTVLLTDGSPTYYVKNDSTSTEGITSAGGNGSDPSDNTINGAAEMAVAVKQRSTLYTICYGVSNDALYVTNSTVCRNCGNAHDQHIAEEVEKTGYFFGIPYPYTATEYYCSEAKDSIWHQSTTTNEVTVGNYLSNTIATAPGNAYNASDIAGVNAAFSAVCSSAVDGMTGSGTTVTDPMGQYIVLGDISGVSGAAASGNTLTWALDSSTLVGKTTSGNTTTYTYSITYPITLDTAAEGFKETNPDGSIKYYPANGYTYLTVGDKKVAFPVPGVCGTVPSIPYTVEYYLQGDNAAGDYANYDLADTETPGAVKAWSTVSAPAGYAKKFASSNYTFVNGTASLQVTPNGDNVIRLYYDRITANVTVNHYYKTDVTDSLGNTAEGSYPAFPNKTATVQVNAGSSFTAALESVFNGESYTFQTANPQLTITVSADADNVINLYYTRTLNTYSYTVVYDGNGGALNSGDTSYGDAENVSETFAASHTVSVDENSFSRTHYVFLGWNESADGTGKAYTAEEAIALTPADSTKTLYAQWQEDPKYSYSLSYNANFGTNPAVVDDEQNIVDTYADTYAIEVNKNMFRRANYTFIGWNTEADGSGTAYSAEDVVALTAADNAEVLYAQWLENTKYDYALSYNANFGTDPATADDEQNIAGIYDEAYAIEVNKNMFTRENYTFIGWNTQADGKGTAYAAGSTVALTAADNAEVLYAQWQENTKYDYALIYNANFGTNPATANDEQNISGTYADTYTMDVNDNMFSRKHYDFIGWALSTDGEVVYQNGDKVNFTESGSITLYAQWVEHGKYSYTVVYNGNGGALENGDAAYGDAENAAGIYDTAYDVSVDANTFIRENYTFIGWNTEADGTGTAYTAEEVIALTAADNTRTLYAQWEVNSYDYTVVYMVRVGSGEYIRFTGTLPENAPLGAQAAYGTVIDETVLQLPAELSDDANLYSFTAVTGTVVDNGENVVYVYYSAPEIVEIPEEDVPLVDIPEEDVPLADTPSTGDNPHTGDPIFVYVGLSVVSGFGILALNLKKKEEDTEE